MNLIAVEGGRRLGGELTVQSAKNGVLPVLAAAMRSRPSSARGMACSWTGVGAS